jgi:hypothetical protein
VAEDGVLIAGFSLGAHGPASAPSQYDVAAYDAHCEAVGLSLAARFATWDGQPFPSSASAARSSR